MGRSRLYQCPSIIRRVPVRCNPALSQVQTPNKHERELIKTALKAYQELKTKIVADEQKRLGPNLGSATGFARKDWTDRNDLL